MNFRVFKTPQHFALKVAKPPASLEDEIAKYRMIAQFALEEKQIHIVKLVKVDSGMLLMELCECTLGAWISRPDHLQQPNLREKVMDFFAQMCSAVKFLHSHRIAHLDLKPQNVFLMKCNAVDTVKLGDFGSSVQMGEGQVECWSRKSSPAFACPRYIFSYLYPFNAFALDVWSLGIILVNMLTATLPWEYPGMGCRKYNRWHGAAHSTTRNVTRRPWSTVNSQSSAVYEFLCTRMLHLDPDLRANILEVERFCAKHAAGLNEHANT